MAGKRTNNGKTIYQGTKFYYDGYLYSINPNGDIYKEIMTKTLEQLTNCLLIHKRVIVIVSELHLGQYDSSNVQITKLIKNIKRYIAKEYQTKDIGHIWVREKERAKSQHYHMALFISGKVVNYPDKILGKMKELWEPEYSQKLPNPYYFIDKKLSNIDDATYRLSYFAKTRGKGYRKQQIKDYSTSRIIRPQGMSMDYFCNT